MNFLNMFSDEAPISNNGYRSSLYTDPSIRQGIDFLKYEKNMTNNLSGNLRLISQTDGSNLGSGKVINGKIYEGMEMSGSAPATTGAAPATTGAAPTEDPDIAYLVLTYEMVNSFYEDTLNNFKIDYQGGLANTPVGPDGTAISGQRSQIVKSIENIESSLGNINVEISGIVKKRSKINIDAYYTIMDQIRVVKSQIIDANNQIEELTKKVDPTSAIAEREETHILSKQKYYMYILWFIIAAIVIYVTIVNMINPNASFSVLVICIIILVCIFVFIMYNNITGAWYNDIKNGISDISIPRMENSFQNMFNFDPLVSIKYTS
jgi:hypothetical protein